MVQADGLIKKYADNWIYNTLSGLLTFLFVSFCWIFFKSASFGAATDMVHQITTNMSLSVWPEFWDNYHNVVLLLLLGYAMHLLPDDLTDRLLPRYAKMPLPVYVGVFLLFLLVYAQFKSSTPVMPIYLQF